MQFQFDDSSQYNNNHRKESENVNYKSNIETFTVKNEKKKK